MKKYIINILIIIICAIFLTSSTMHFIEKSEININKKDKFTPTSLILESNGIESTEKFKTAVSNEVQKILSGDIILTVYSDGVEDFCYYGEAELINDGSDGTEIILIIHEDKKVSLDDVF